LSNPANAWPAVFVHLNEVFQAIKVSGNVNSFLMSSLFADGVGFVDIVDASYFKIMGAVSSHGNEGEEGKYQQ
jgi:phosphoribosylaminoimidazole (AIR) synthetase